MPRYHFFTAALLALLLTLSEISPAATTTGDALTFDPAAWVPDGPVYAIQSDPVSGRTYLGGDFESLNPYTGHLLAVGTADAQATAPAGFPTLDGPVYAIAGNTQYGWYVGGDFHSASGAPRANLLHLNPDLSLDAAWAPVVDGPIYAIGIHTPLSGVLIYVGGDFQKVNGQPRTNLAALDKTGALQSWTPNPDGPVRALLVFPTASAIFAGGAFHHLGGQARNALGALELKGAGNATPWTPTPSLDDLAEVRALAMINSSAGPATWNILAGGTFSVQAAGGQRSHLACYDAYGKLVENLDFQVDGPIYSLLFSNLNLKGQVGRDIYASGAFTHIAGFAAPGLAHLVLNQDGTLTPDPEYVFQLDGLVYTIAQFNATLQVNKSEQLIGGAFKQAQGSDQPGLFRVQYNAATQRYEVQDWSPRIQRRNGAVRAAIYAGTRVLAGGDFFSAGGQRQSNLAALDPAGRAIPGWDVGTDGPVSALAWSEGRLFFGGQFDHVTRQGVEEASPNAGAALADGSLLDWRPAPDGPVSALAAAADSAGTVIALGGAFQRVSDPLTGSVERPYLALIRAVDGGVTSLAPSPDGPVRALAIQGDVLFAGGSFTHVNGQPLAYAAGIDLTGAREPVGLAATRPVVALEVSDRQIYLTEDPPEPGGDPLQGRLEVFDWPSTGPAVEGQTSLRGWLPALEAGQQRVYLGGAVPSAEGGSPRPFLAALDPQTQAVTELVTLLPWGGPAVSTVRAIRESGGRLMAGGDFRGADGREHPYYLVMQEQKTETELHCYLPLVRR